MKIFPKHSMRTPSRRGNPTRRWPLVLQISAASIFASYAAFGPALGFGVGEDAWAYRWFGLSRHGALAMALICLSPALAIGGLRALSASWRWALREPNPSAFWLLDWSRRNLVPGAVVTLLCLVVTGAGFEIWCRATTPFRGFWITERWFHPEAGLLYRPGSEVRKSNQLEFWQATTVNSQGFLDREPATVRAPNACRVAFIGDSYFEAAEIPIDGKAHVLLENLAGNRLGFPIEAVAYAISGTGQVNQLAYYDTFLAKSPPDVIVLAIVRNDLGDNHPGFQAMGYETLPDSLPFRTIRPDGDGFREVPPNANWRQEAPEAPSRPLGSRRARFTEFLTDYSYGYLRLIYWLQLVAPEIAAWLRDLPDDSPAQRAHAAAMRARIAAQLGDPLVRWTNEIDDDVTTRIVAGGGEPLVYAQAFAATEWAFRAFAARAKRDQVRLVALKTWWLTKRLDTESEPNPIRFAWAPYINARFESSLAAAGIPVLDQANWVIDREKRPLRDASFRRDMHWSPEGHKWTAHQILDFLENDPQACARSKRMLSAGSR